MAFLLLGCSTHLHSLPGPIGPAAQSNVHSVLVSRLKPRTWFHHGFQKPRVGSSLSVPPFLFPQDPALESWGALSWAFSTRKLSALQALWVLPFPCLIKVQSFGLMRCSRIQAMKSAQWVSNKWLNLPKIFFFCHAKWSWALHNVLITGA